MGTVTSGVLQVRETICRLPEMPIWKPSILASPKLPNKLTIGKELPLSTPGVTAPILININSKLAGPVLVFESAKGIMQ
ncbi:hypothetical protein D3C72_2405720 [compost metagenome]